MPKQEAVVMSNIADLTYLFGDEKIFEQAVCSAFSPKIIAELTALGDYLRRHAQGEANIVALGFWLRSAHLKKIAQEYQTGNKRQGRGLAFHIAPANVDTLFFYSIIVSILAGNPTILRLSSRQSDTGALLIDLFKKAVVTKNLNHLQSNISIVHYAVDKAAHHDDFTHELSLKSSLRAVWGSDDTIAKICQLPQCDDGKTVTFPNRYSCALLSLTEANVSQAAEQFVADIKPFYQQACSSPKLVYWLNTQNDIKDKFWQLVDDKIGSLLPPPIFTSPEQIERLVYKQQLAIAEQGLMSIAALNIINRFKCENVERATIDSHPGLYQLLEIDISALAEIKLFEHCQTLAYYGIDVAELANINSTYKRHIALGQSLLFSHHWDGVDMINAFSVEQDH